MFKLDKEMLLSLFKLSAPSNKEGLVQQFIIQYLTDNDIPFEQDKTGNIYRIDIKNAPILSAHMDTVERPADEPMTKFVNIYNYDGKDYLRGYGVIGGDDKCGIFIILSIIKTYQVNFVFSVGEENGMKGITDFMTDNKAKLNDIFYGLVLDRRGSSDIICLDNYYGTYAFENELKKIGTEFGYKPARGFASDANHLKEKFSCANLSVGYYNPHSTKEFVSLDDLQNAHDFVVEIITTIKTKYEPYVFASTGYGSSSYSYTYCAICNKSKESARYVTALKKYVCHECAKEIFDYVNQNEYNKNWMLGKTKTWY